MKIFQFFFVLHVFIAPLAKCQESLVREHRPYAVKAGTEGLGMDYSIGNICAVDVSTFAFYHSLKARVFLFERNASPYVGVGVGSFNGVMSETDANRWVSYQLGWEHSYEVVQIQLYLQRPFSEKNNSSYVPLTVNLSVGMRVLY
jgi:hypothetical protein